MALWTCLLSCLLLVSLVSQNVYGEDLETDGHLDDTSPITSGFRLKDRKQTSAMERFFALVKFHPEVCGENLLSTTPATDSIGTCTTSTDCTNRGGRNIGTCAKGFGVCCLITLMTTPQNPYQTVRDRSVTLQGGVGATMSNFEFPKLDGSCQLLVEFLQFDLAAPPPATGECTEYMRITGSVTVNSGFTICGLNTDQRIFLSYGRGERITLEFNTPNNGNYRVRVRHVRCSDTALLAPLHCLQNYITSTGVVRSFAYGRGMATAQEYTVCIQEQSVTRNIQWLECADNDPGIIAGLRSQFFLSNYFLPLAVAPAPPIVLMGPTGYPCETTSYVEVYGERKHCGAKFTINTANGQTPVRSSAKPYQLFVRTAVNSYALPVGAPATGYQIIFPYPIMTAVPAPIPNCMQMGAAAPLGAQAFTTCTESATALTCMCTYAPPVGPTPPPIDPAMPPRTGFCLKYTLM